MNDRVLVSAKEVWKVYRTGSVEAPALRGVTLEVREGDFLAVVGLAPRPGRVFCHCLPSRVAGGTVSPALVCHVTKLLSYSSQTERDGSPSMECRAAASERCRVTGLPLRSRTV